MKKRILFVVTKAGLGGAGKYVLDCALHTKKTHSVELAAGGVGALTEKMSAAQIPVTTIPYLERDVGLLKEFRVFFFLIEFLVKNKPDVVHLNSPKAGALGALAARIAGVKKIIYTAHGWAFYENRSPAQQSLIKFISWIIVLLSTRVIAVSTRDYHAFDGWLFTNKKIVYIPNGISTKTTTDIGQARKTFETFGVDTNKKIVGTIAELHKNKGLSYLIEAAREIPEAVFVVVGEGEERKNLQYLIDHHSLHDRFYLTGHIENASSALPVFDIFALPSVKEGLPYVLLEAGAVGLPVVASRVGGIPDVIKHEKNGLLIDLKSNSQLTTAIKTLLENEALAQNYGTALQETVQTKFAIEQMLEKTIELYS